MTRKDFELIARVIRTYTAEYGISDFHRLLLATEFANELCAQNARFDQGRFLEACGVKVNPS